MPNNCSCCCCWHTERQGQLGANTNGNMLMRLSTCINPFTLPLLMHALQGKVEKLNAQIEKENQLKNLTSLNLSAAVGSSDKSLATEKV